MDLAQGMETIMRRTFLIAMALAWVSSAASAQNPEPSPRNAMKIKFVLNGTPVSATLEDNATSRDFLAVLPLKVKLEDYAAIEKIAYLPKKLSTEGAPKSMLPRAGDVTYYAPWGNLAIFHKDFRKSPGLVKLGHLDRGLEALRQVGTTEITIEREGN